MHYVWRQGLPLILLAAVMWGTIGAATKGIYSLADTNAFSISLLRLVLALPLLIGASVLALGRSALAIPRRDLGLMALTGVIMATYQVTYVAAVGQIGVTVATLITLCTQPVLVSLLSGLLLGERITPAVLLAMICATVGAALLVLAGPGGARGATLSGVILALISALGYGTTMLLGRVLSSRYHPLQSITVSVGVAMLTLLPGALASGLTLGYPTSAWALLLYLAVFPTVAAYLLFFRGMRDTPATVASITVLVEPLTATLLGWLIFDERLGVGGLLGAALLVGAVGILYRSRSKALRPSPDASVTAEGTS